MSEAVERAARDKPDDAWAHYYLAYACLYTGKESRAFKEIDRAIKLQPNEAEFYGGKVQMLQNRGKGREAFAPGKECLARNATNWVCCYYLAHAYFAGQDVQTACELFEQGIRANFGAPSLHAGAAQSLKGDGAAAVVSLQRAIALLETQGIYAQPLFESDLAVAHQHLNHINEAPSRVLRAQRHGSKDPKLRRIIHWANRPR